MDVPRRGGGGGAKGSKGDRLARLAAPPVERWAKCEAQRQQRQAAAMQPCTFRPKTAKHTGRLSRCWCAALRAFLLAWTQAHCRSNVLCWKSRTLMLSCKQLAVLDPHETQFIERQRRSFKGVHVPTGRCEGQPPWSGVLGGAAAQGGGGEGGAH